MNATPDAADLAAWIGRTESVEDILTPRLASAFAGLFGPARSFSVGEPVTGAVHWCLTPSVVGTIDLDVDGHIRRGGFLPPVALPRRMWAASRTIFHDTLRCGDVVRRTSAVRSIETKDGRSGALCFVEIDHDYETDRGRAVSEVQTIVYRDAAAASPPTGAGPASGGPDGFAFDTVLLFRYSALTFNSHRIHYDLAYARDVEHYPGLVVHGPLQASWLLDKVVRDSGMPRRFSFRGVAPLIVGRQVSVRTGLEDGKHTLALVDDTGTTTLKATVE